MLPPFFSYILACSFTSSTRVILTALIAVCTHACTHTHSTWNRNHVACIHDTVKPVDCFHIFVFVFNLCNRNSCSSKTMVWRMFYYIIIVVVSVQVSPVARINRSLCWILERKWKWKSDRFIKWSIKIACIWTFFLVCGQLLDKLYLSLLICVVIDWFRRENGPTLCTTLAVC